MLTDLFKKLGSRNAGSSTATAPIHGDHSHGRDVEYLFRRRRYAGSRDRKYLVHLPPAYSRGKHLPVLMVLHGCDQTHEDMRDVTNFDALADRHGIIVIYPFVTSYDSPRMRNCWAFWSSQHNRAGAGEVEDLWRILSDVRKRFGADRNRMHVAGLSSGAAMTVALLVNRCDAIASGAEVAGLPFSETASALGQLNPKLKSVKRIAQAMAETMGERRRAVPLMIVHAKGDPIISVRAADRVRDSWAACFEINLKAAAQQRDGVSNGTAWVHTQHASAEKTVETLILDHNQHGWYGGNDGRYGYADGPDVSAMIWDFLDRHRLDGRIRSPFASLRALLRRAA